MRRILATLIGTLFALVVAWGLTERLGRVRAEQALTGSAFRGDSLEAVSDTTRNLTSPALTAVLGDSMAAFQRRMLQARQVSDSLDRALGQERAANVYISARADSLEAVIHAIVLASNDSGRDERSAEFSIRQAPYQVVAHVALPAPPGDGRMTVHVALDSAVFRARVGCGPPGAGGVRPASITLLGPEWIHVRIGEAEQVPEVCSAGATAFQGRALAFPRFVAGVGGAVGYSAGSLSFVPTLFVGVGVSW